MSILNQIAARNFNYHSNLSQQGIIAQPVGNVVAGAGVPVFNLSTIDTNKNAKVKNYDVIEIDEDILALSVRLHKEKISNPNRYYDSVIANELFDLVDQDDRNTANDIRKYYSQKLLFLKLKKENLSKFREDLNTFIHKTDNVFKNDLLPLVYRLPEFYKYDLAFDKLRIKFNKTLDLGDEYRNSFKSTRTLTYVESFVTGKAVHKRKELWFHDEFNNLVYLPVLMTNPLLSLLEKQLNDKIIIVGIFQRKVRDDLEFLLADKYSFV